MRRHYIVAPFLLIFAGLSLYQGFHGGEMGYLIWTGIVLAVLGVLVFFYHNLSPWLKRACVVLPLIFIGVMVIKDLISGLSVGSIVGGVALIYVVAVAFFHDKPFAKEKVRPWSLPFAYIVLGILLTSKLFTIFVVERKMVESPKPVGFRQNPNVSPESAFNSDLHVEKGPVYNGLQQKAMNILASEEVKQEIKAAAAAGTRPEFLESISNFKDYMISKGVTEFAILDQVPSHYQELFQKQYPGKSPSDLDSEMRQRLIEMIQEFGYDKGREKFLRTPEIAVWTAARFNLFGDDETSISAWTKSVYADEFGDAADASDSNALTPMSQEANSFAETSPEIFFTENETAPSDRAPTEVGEDSPIPDAVDRDVTPPAVKPEKVVTKVSPEPPALSTEAVLETTLRERFSSERFDRAWSTLERYGPEEGLRRIREDDPEVAKQIERHRNKSGREEKSQ